VQIFWGIAADGSVVISDNLDVIKASCAKSFAPFPSGKFSTYSFAYASQSGIYNNVKTFDIVASCGTASKLTKQKPVL